MTGRPKKAAQQRRTNLLRIRLSVAKRAALEEAARQQSLETSTWARFELLNRARQLLKQREKE
jgi:hypothetical protein